MYKILSLVSKSTSEISETTNRLRHFTNVRGKHRKYSPRCYHTGSRGVYGHRNKYSKKFEVPKEELEIRSRNSNFYRLVTAYREHGHKQANADLIALSKPEPLPELGPERFGLTLTDNVSLQGLVHADKTEATVAEALEILNKIYSGTISAEFSYLETEEEREWFAKNFERCFHEEVDKETRRAIAGEMLKSQAFDRFLAVKFVSVKRYGGEGAESMMAFFHELFEQSVTERLKQLVLCMPHRGRLNFLTGMLGLPPEKLFRKLRGPSEFPEDARATGDVVSHFVSSTQLGGGSDAPRVSLLYNPSHLEAVNPVSMGRTRALMQVLKDGDYSDEASARWSDKVLNVQVHGDAAYAGQGVNQECLALSGAPHFEVGGSIHLVVNNQVGFTTPAKRGRSSRYSTDLAKFIASPVIHVNGDEPEMVVRATRLAFRYQRKFRKDVFVDLNCFRRWGHNELDDPTFTNPLRYKIIHGRQFSIPDRYLHELSEAGVLSEEQGAKIAERHTAKLAEALQRVDEYVPRRSYFTGRWSQMKQPEPSVTTWDTGVDANLLRFIAAKSVEYPADFEIHPTLVKSHVESRLKKVASGSGIDWATAEAMAFGSLLYQGYNVRISGQDVGRGTFSQRHAMLVDQSNGGIHIPLNEMSEGQVGKLELANSILSEEAVLGYEYGMSVSLPATLCLWEAQFGDFFNGAQVMIDTFVSSGEAKWMLASGLTMLLPHGYDGAGPEHSSCKLERFLQLSDSAEDRPDSDQVNLHIVNPTTPAQYFHLLRRQMVRNFRKPLIVVGPKTLLRLASATSTLEQMSPGTGFKPILGDPSGNEDKIRKVILVSGKHFYALDKYKQTCGIEDVAIVRIESLCPFPVAELNEEIEKYKNAKLFIWSQEEPQNMGAWSFVKSRFENMCGRRLRYSGREPLATSAVGIGQLHQQQSEEVVVKPFAMK